MPYQIIHTFDGFLANLDGASIVLGRGEAQKVLSQVEKLLEERLNELKARGIDGLVVNVGGPEYLESPEGWELFLISDSPFGGEPLHFFDTLDHLCLDLRIHRNLMIPHV